MASVARLPIDASADAPAKRHCGCARTDALLLKLTWVDGWRHAEQDAEPGPALCRLSRFGGLRVTAMIDLPFGNSAVVRVN
jgi:hypothetical protein